MSWKKVFFFGGAVLVLSACNDATAPTTPALTKLDRASASAKTSTSTPTTTAVGDSTAVPNQPTSCVGVVIHTGLDGSLIITCPPVVW